MKVLVVSGIFPPDIGGPATHAADLSDELRERGHTVSVMSYDDAFRPIVRDDVVRFPRSWPWPVRTVVAIAWLARAARRFDIVYATGLGPVAVLGARLARRPIVLKVVGDPVWERGARLGLVGESFDAFQNASLRGVRLRLMRWVRNWSLRHTTVVVTPSEYLSQHVQHWTGRDDVVTVPNGARCSATRSEPDENADGSLRLLYVGRLVAHKRVDVLVRAVARCDGVRLEVAGDGPELHRLQELSRRENTDDRVRFVGRLSHDAVARRMTAADALVLASSYEGLPHVVVEALVCGTPVIATEAGGVTEVVHHGVNGLLIRSATPEAFAATFAELEREAVREDLRRGAAATGAEWHFDRCADRLEALMHRAASERPHVVVIAKSRTSVPPRPDDVTKYRINARHVRTTVVCPARPAGLYRPGGATVVGLPGCTVPVIGTAMFYTVAPVVALGLACGRRRTAITCQSPYEGFGVVALATLVPHRWRPRVQIELHGDWRTATRTYGSHRRRFLSPAADRIAVWALRRADRVRCVSDALGQLAREAGYRGPLDRHVAFSDYDAFMQDPPVPPPEAPHAVFVGALELHKAPDLLLDAWSDVVKAHPTAQLTLVGAGSLEQQLRSRARDDELEGTAHVVAPMSRAQLAELFDRSSCLVLPSLTEGLGRVVLEAMARGRPVVASAVGGIVELVVEGTTGRLVPPGDAGLLAAAIIETLNDRDRARAMGHAARCRALAWDPLRDYELGIARLGAWISA